ncbi:transcription elongation factor GreA [Candidatus Gracilibacteria bacterium 28_42_T64]|nr:transcription elongation factor GreA [Candidatus Gracilibacteria bacterium 28_42_T64]
MSKTVYLTKEGLKNLEQEFDTLKNVTRVEIAAKLKEAISFGDLSENAEYEEARNEQAQVELRITDVESQLKNVELIDENIDHDKVTMGTIVMLQNVSDKKKETYKIVGSTEANILAEPPMISNESPVGKAILGKKSGTTVKVNAPSGKFEYKIIEIK